MYRGYTSRSSVLPLCLTALPQACNLCGCTRSFVTCHILLFSLSPFPTYMLEPASYSIAATTSACLITVHAVTSTNSSVLYSSGITSSSCANCTSNTNRGVSNPLRTIAHITVPTNN